jgi:fatty acid desaturase
MIENLKEYLKPELLSIVPVLYLCGMWMKQSTRIKDEKIPVLLGLIGILLSSIYTLSVTPLTDYRDVLSALFVSVTQGILCAGASVYWHQIVHQNFKANALINAPDTRENGDKD